MTDFGPAFSRAIASPLLGLAIGAVAGLLGLIPGLLGGGRLLLQNLWATRTMPEDMPFVLLPVSQYYVTVLLAVLVIGGVLAGLGIHLLRRRRPIASWPAAIGLGGVHAIAITQTFVVLAVGLDVGGSDPRALLYFAGMLGGALVSAVLAQAGFWLTSRVSVAPVALGVALAAVPFASWFSYSVNTITGPVNQPLFLIGTVRWLPVVIIGIALAWCGIRPLRRLVVWVIALLALWLLRRSSSRFWPGSGCEFCRAISARWLG